MKGLHYSKKVEHEMNGRPIRPAFRITDEMLHDAGTFMILAIWILSFMAACAVYIGLL